MPLPRRIEKRVEIYEKRGKSKENTSTPDAKESDKSNTKKTSKKGRNLLENEAIQNKTLPLDTHVLLRPPTRLVFAGKKIANANTENKSEIKEKVNSNINLGENIPFSAQSCYELPHTFTFYAFL